MYLHLLTLTASLLAENQLAIFCSSSLQNFIKSFKFLPAERQHVSSAKRRVKSFEAVYKSLIKHMNKRGPRTLPCMTEMLIFRGVDRLPLMSTH